ncbi:MAG: hypothetical protein ACI915_003036 [Gammaproteobacteria bacterium]|jgi:hypothetical protein
MSRINIAPALATGNSLAFESGPPDGEVPVQTETDIGN